MKFQHVLRNVYNTYAEIYFNVNCDIIYDLTYLNNSISYGCFLKYK